MIPPYEITTEILNLIASISIKIGEVNANLMDKPSPRLRKQNKIKTIHASLKIEGNTMSQEQITALLDNKRVIAPKKDLQEVLNAIRVYEQLNRWKVNSEKSFLQAHAVMMSGLVDQAGKYRKDQVGIVHGSDISHIAPPASNVPYLMKDLFTYLKESSDLSLIKSCVFHYEMEFIHPFMDGNGRMGRLWQTLILAKEYPLFEFLPFETLIIETQDAYYKALSDSDKCGKSTPFITYMLDVIDRSLDEVLHTRGNIQTEEDRLRYFVQSDIR